MRLLRCRVVGCKLGLANLNVLAYADDVVLLAPSMTALQNLVY